MSEEFTNYQESRPLIASEQLKELVQMTFPNLEPSEWQAQAGKYRHVTGVTAHTDSFRFGFKIRRQGSDTVLEIEDFQVQEEGVGKGTQLLNNIESLARHAGCNKSVIIAERQEARGFWEKRGYSFGEDTIYSKEKDLHSSNKS
jgi:GNAT superfamily N-acetyltransferase